MCHLQSGLSKNLIGNEISPPSAFATPPLASFQFSEMKAQLDYTEIKDDTAVPYAAVRDINGKAHSSLNIDAIAKSTSPSNVSLLLILIYRPKSKLVLWIRMSCSTLQWLGLIGLVWFWSPKAKTVTDQTM